MMKVQKIKNKMASVDKSNMIHLISVSLNVYKYFKYSPNETEKYD